MKYIIVILSLALSYSWAHSHICHLSPAVINGADVDASESSFVVQVRQRIKVNEFNDGESLCCGTFISQKTVVTSCHCVDLL